MQINLSPVRSNEALTLSRVGDVLTINGQSFDFTQLAEGATLPAEAVGSDYFVDTVERIGGELRLTLRLPHAYSPRHVETPQPITVTQDGPVELPA